MSTRYFDWLDLRFAEVLQLVRDGDLSVTEANLFFNEELRSSYQRGFSSGAVYFEQSISEQTLLK